MARIVMRADASPEIGMGHVERSARLGEALAAAGHDVSFVTRAGTLGAERLRARGLGPFEIDEDGEETPAVLDGAPRLVVFDVGNTSHDRVAGVKRAGATVVTFDDLGDGRYLADDVVDANLSDRTNPRRMETTTRFHLGPSYAVVDPSLAARRRRKYGRLRTVVAALGGTDPENLAVRVVRALSPLEAGIEVTVVLGPGYRGGRGLDEALLDSPRDFDVRVAPPDFTALLRGADLGIVGGGLTLFEAAAAGLPSIVLAQNKAQLANAQRFAEDGAAVHLGLGRNVPAEEILGAVRAMEDPERRRAVGEAAAARVDGRGLERVRALCLEAVAA